MPKKHKVGQPMHGLTPKKNAGISLEVSVIKELDRIVQEQGFSNRSQLVNHIIEQWLFQH